MSLKLEQRSLRQRLVFPLILFFLVFAGYAYWSASTYCKDLKDERILKTRHLTEAAFGVIEREYQRFRTGEISEAVAKQRAKNIIGLLRYDEIEYFWINDFDGQAVMHPLLPEIVGQDLSKTNKRVYDLYITFAEISKGRKGAQHSYEWQKPGEDKALLFEKMSYVKAFEPWEWVLGTGVYITDLNKKHNQKLITNIFAIFCMFACLLVINVFTIRSITKLHSD